MSLKLIKSQSASPDKSLLHFRKSRKSTKCQPIKFNELINEKQQQDEVDHLPFLKMEKIKGISDKDSGHTKKVSEIYCEMLSHV